MLVRDATGEQAARACPSAARSTSVCGDEVRCRIDAHHDEVHVIEVLPRRTALWRANAARRRRAGGGQPHAAAGGARAAAGRRTCSSSTAISPRRPPRGIAATLVVNKSDLALDARAGALS